MAEWLGTALQKPLQRFESARDLLIIAGCLAGDLFIFLLMIRVLHFTGIAAGILLVIACFLPWTYHADINQTFTGLYSYKNQYGRPGKFLVLIGVLSVFFMLLPKLWAKRVNLFLTALGLGYAIKTFVLFTSCYNAYCPSKQLAIYIMLYSSIILLAAAIFPSARVRKSNIRA